VKQLSSRWTTAALLALGLFLATTAVAQDQQPKQEQPQAQQAPNNASQPAPGEQVWKPGEDNATTQGGQQKPNGAGVPPPPNPYETGAQADQPSQEAPPAPPGAQPADAEQQGSPVLKQRPLEPIAQPSSRTLQAGVEMFAVLDQALSTRTGHAGDPFTATLVEPLRNREGEIVVPAGAILVGQVSEVRKGRPGDPRPQAYARMTLHFESLLMGGTETPLLATLEGVSGRGGRGRSANAEGEIRGGISGQDVARALGIGGGAGTLLGAMMGSPWKGLAIGLIAGGGYLMTASGMELELPANTGLVLRLDEPLTLPVQAYGAPQQQPPIE